MLTNSITLTNKSVCCYTKEVKETRDITDCDEYTPYPHFLTANKGS